MKTKSTYTKKDFNSNDGMLTSVWGPIFWFFLHTMSFNYPVNPTEENKKEYREFILSLQNILPCGDCRKNLKINFEKLPLTKKWMKNRETFSRYIYELHEIVNKMLNKKSDLTYEDIRERFELFRAKCIKSKSHIGCFKPFYGNKVSKPKCVIKVIPNHIKEKSITIHRSCKIKKK